MGDYEVSKYVEIQEINSLIMKSYFCLYFVSFMTLEVVYFNCRDTVLL